MSDGEEKLPCGCYGKLATDGAIYVTASAFLCPERHSQGDRANVPAFVPGMPACPHCDGDGEVAPHNNPDGYPVICGLCDGTGVMKATT